MSSREAILARIRSAIADAPEPSQIVRDYLPAHVPDDPSALVDQLAQNLTDYRARVHRATQAELPAALARLLADRGSRSVAVPTGLPPHWLAEATTIAQYHDANCELTARELDAIDSVVTGCRLAIAETGTIVLDTGPGQGRRALTLVPDHHICVVRTADQIVASLPHALPRLDPRRPLTWISGPSATSDIELDRVEGVHGPRILDIVLLDDGQISDEADDSDEPGGRDRPGTELQSAAVAGDGEPVGEGRAERPGDDVGEPERDGGVEPQPPVGDQRDEDDEGEHDA